MTHQELLGQIKIIREKLWSNNPYGNVSVLVGAGFSKNSIPLERSLHFPDWSELATRLLDGLYPDDSTDARKRREAKCEVPSYIMKLAQEYVELFSQKELNNLLVDSIPDKKFVPSELHDRLLTLPFKDIFTTNYDTLLDRAADRNLEREYKVITTVDELSGSLSPRIIKLHGSFPNIIPFIITEEDYRNYPKKFKPFINTVVQSLIENTLILIGFSGEDPNFLNWIGWIRDELPNSRQKIYICTIDQQGEFNEAQKRLFAKRGIEILDLYIAVDNKEIYEKSSNIYYESLSWFLDQLKLGEKKESEKKWPENVDSSTLRKKYDTKKDNISIFINGFYRYLYEIRKTYPGWIITPLDNRIILNESVLNYDLNQIDEIYHELSFQQFIILIDNYFWYKHVILTSISVAESNKIRAIVDELMNKNKMESNENFLFNNILIYLYIDARENLEIEQMEKYLKFIESRSSLTKDQEEWLNVEIAIYCLKVGNFKLLREITNNWDLSSDKLSHRSLMKISILMELGENTIVKDTLLSLLKELRSTKNKNLFYKSSEGICIYLLQRLEDYNYNSDNNENKDFDERLAILGNDNCNPLNHIKEIRTTINKFKKSEKYGDYRIKKFDPFRYRLSYNSGSTYSTIEENRFVNFFDYAPIPIRDNKYVALTKDVFITIAENTIRRHPLNIIPFLTRFRATQVFEEVIDRVLIFSLNNQSFDILKRIYINSFTEMVNVITTKEKHDQVKSEIDITKTLLCIVSYMIPRLESDSLNLIMSNILKLINYSEIIKLYENDLVLQALSRIVSQKRYFCDENITSINSYFNLRIPRKIDLRFNSNNYPNTVIESLDNIKIIRHKIIIDTSLLNELRHLVSSEDNDIKQYCILRLLYYFEYGLAQSLNREILSKIIWDYVQESGEFKLDTLRIWVALKYRPRSKNDEIIYNYYKNRIRNLDFTTNLIPPRSIGGETEFSLTINAMMDITEWYNNKLSIKKISWNSNDSDAIFSKLFDSWGHIKEELEISKNGFFHFGIQVLRDHYEIIFKFIQVCLKTSSDTISKHSDAYIDMFNTLIHNKICIPELLLFEYKKKENQLLIKELLYSSNRKNQGRTIEALINWICTIPSANTLSQSYIIELSEIIRNRRQPGLFKALDYFSLLVTNKDDFVNNDEVLSNLSYGLNRLEKETSISDDNIPLDEIINNYPTVEIPDYRALASKLVYHLLKMKNVKRPIRSELREIKSNFQIDKYPEVRNPWT